MPVTENIEWNFGQWVSSLASNDALVRLEAIEIAQSLPQSSEEIVRCLEKAALSDVDDSVAQAAEAALLAFPHQPVYRSLVNRDETARKFMLYELAGLETAGLVGKRAARLIRARYALDAVPNPLTLSKAAAPETSTLPNLVPETLEKHTLPAAKQSAPSLTQILLSETTIKIALYLGAFFVVAAAFILAALVEVSRLPVLGITTLVFLGTSLGLSRRLPLASFVLFCVTVLMVPIDGQVLLPVIRIEASSAVLFYWGAVWLVTLIVSTLGLFFYRSRLLSLVAFLAGGVSLFYLGQGLKLDFEVQILLFGAWNLLGLGMAYGLKRRFGTAFFWPIFIITSMSMLILLGVSFSDWAAAEFKFILNISGLKESLFNHTPLPLGWTSLLWLAGSGFFLLSDRLTRGLKRPWGGFYPLLVVGSLLPAPVLFISQWNFSIPAFLTGIWAWGILSAVFQETTRRATFKMAKGYAFCFLLGFVFYSCLVPAAFASYENHLGVTISLAGSAVAALILSRLKLRWYINCVVVLFAVAAYFSMFLIPQVEPLRDLLLTGEITLAPALVLLGLDWFVRRRGWSRQVWVPAQAAGTVLFLFDFILILIAPYFPYGKAAWPEGRLFVLICVQALFAGFYAATFKQPFNAIAWSFSALAGYLAVFYLMNIPDVIALNLFTPVVTCVPTLVLLGIEWRLRQQRKAASWIIPPLVIGIFAVIINFLQLFGSRPDQVWMVVAILAGYALFWGWESRSLKTVLWLPWFLSLSCAYAAYLLFWTIPAVVNLNLDVLFVRLPPALLLLGLEWLLRKRAADYSWRVAPLLLGGTAVVINIFPVLAIFPEETWMVTTLLGIYTVFFTLEASWLKNRLSWLPWSIALTSFYAMYLYFWQIPGVSSLHTSGLITSVFPIFLFLSLEWQLRRHGKGKIWTWPALTAGSIALVVNVVAIILAPASDSSLVLINCVLTALLLGAYSFSGIKPVFVYWTFALCFAWVAYWKLFDQHWFLFSTWKDEVKLLPLAVIFLGLDLFLRKRKFERERWLPVLLMGMAAALFNIILALAGGLESHPAVEPALILPYGGCFSCFIPGWMRARGWVIW